MNKVKSMDMLGFLDYDASFEARVYIKSMPVYLSIKNEDCDNGEACTGFLLTREEALELSDFLYDAATRFDKELP